MLSCRVAASRRGAIVVPLASARIFVETRHGRAIDGGLDRRL